MLQKEGFLALTPSGGHVARAARLPGTANSHGEATVLLVTTPSSPPPRSPGRSVPSPARTSGAGGVTWIRPGLMSPHLGISRASAAKPRWQRRRKVSRGIFDGEWHASLQRGGKEDSVTHRLIKFLSVTSGHFSNSSWMVLFMGRVKLKQTHIELQGCLKRKNRLASNSNLNSAKAKSHTEVPICFTESGQKGQKLLVLHWVLLFQTLSLNLNSAAAISRNLLLSLSLCFSHRLPTRRQSNTRSSQLCAPALPQKAFTCWKINKKISGARFALFFKVCDL